MPRKFDCILLLRLAPATEFAEPPPRFRLDRSDLPRRRSLSLITGRAGAPRGLHRGPAPCTATEVCTRPGSLSCRINALRLNGIDGQSVCAEALGGARPAATARSAGARWNRGFRRLLYLLRMALFSLWFMPSRWRTTRREISWRKCHKSFENVRASSVSNLPSERNPYKQSRTLLSGEFCHDARDGALPGDAGRLIRTESLD